MLRRAPAGARPRGPEAHHVEDRPLAHQGEDAGARRPARGRDERAHVLRGRLVRLRRRALRRGPAAPLRGRAGRPAVAPARGSPAQRVDPRDPHPLPGRAQVRRRGARRTLLRGALPGVDTRRRADVVSGRLGAAPGVEHAAGPGAALRGGERRRTPRLPGRSRRLAPRRGRRAVTPARRRRVFVWAAAALVIALVGGRWLAIETAERAWAATVTGGDLYLAARDLARLVQGIILLVSLTWGIGNLYIVYRAIGSVQLPRRLGDLEIVEAVPQRVLLGGTLLAGAAFGLVLALGTGDWWLQATLAARPPRFGVADPVLHRDLGYYVAQLPWAPTSQAYALPATSAATVVVASLVWGLREQSTLLVGSWAALLATSLAVYLVLPGILRSGRAPAADALDPSLLGERRRLEQLAFGTEWLEERGPPGFTTPEAAVAALPVWDADRVAGVARRAHLLGPTGTVATAALSPHRLGGGRATWLIGVAPDLDRLARTQPPPPWTEIHRGPWARAGRALAAVEADSGLELAPVLGGDSVTWFGEGFGEFAVAAPDTWPQARTAGIPLTAWWRRTALAWVLQSPELTRAETDGLVLLWRRDVAERLGRLTPFAHFDVPVPVVADGALWWIAYGYVGGEAFPLARPVAWEGRGVRYLRAAFLGAVSAATGETLLYLAPGADSLAQAWARRYAPLVRPLDSLPPSLRGQLPYPRR